MARPFQAATTLSSRAGCGRLARASSRAVRTRAHRAGSSGSWRSWSVEAPCSNVPASVTVSSPAAHAPSSGPSTSVSWPGVQAYVSPSTPSVSASSAEAKPPSGVRRSLSNQPAVSSATRRARSEPVERHRCAYTRSSNALSYSIFSKCGTTHPASTE